MDIHVPMTCHKSMALLGMQLMLLSTTAQADISYQTYRVDCEPLCQKMQPFSGYCPTYGSCQWYCQEKQANCPPGTRYHCARDLNVEAAFAVVCAQETFCLAGEEPRISIGGQGNVYRAIASVFCRPCFKREMFNDRFNTSSATYSECSSVKTNLCKHQEHKVDCGYVSYRELTKSDGYCRCDAIKGYAASSEQMCFYENKRCFKKTCPEGEELLFDYTCARQCPDGMTRINISNSCQQIVNVSPAVSLLTTRAVEDKASNIQNTTLDISAEQTTDKPASCQAVPKTVVIVLLTVSIGIALVATIRICLTNKYLKGKNTPEIQFDAEQIQLEEMEPFIDEHYKSTEMETTPQSHGASSTSKASPKRTSEKSKEHELFGQELCEDVYQLIADEKSRSLKIIEEILCFDIEYLKTSNFGRHVRGITRYLKGKRNVIPGYVAYELYELLGHESTCLYELISRLISGNGSLRYTIRWASARFASNNFDLYVAKLTKAFRESGKTEDSAKIFFGMHGILFKKDILSKIEQNISKAFKVLVLDTVTGGKVIGPFHVEFLCGVLNCRIIQHFEDNCYNDLDCNTIPGLNVTVTSSEREFHIWWKKCNGHISRAYRVVPLFKDDVQSHGSKVNGSDSGVAPSAESAKPGLIGLDLCATIYNQLARKNKSVRSNCVKVIEESDISDLLTLKDRDIITPDPHFFRIHKTNELPGYQENIMFGDESMSLYEWISLLLFGDVGMQCVIRVAAVRYALLNFDTYVKKLTKVFKKSKNKRTDAKLFFKTHSIEYEEVNDLPIQKFVSRAFASLVRETVNTERGIGPFYLEFLCGVLNCKIIQHFEGARFSDRDVSSIPGLDVTLTNSAREFHFYWRKSSCGCSYTYSVVPLFEMKSTSEAMAFAKVYSKQSEVEREIYQEFCKYITVEERFRWEICLERIDRSQVFGFDSLKHRPMNEHDTYFYQMYEKVKVPGYRAYEKPGYEPPCLYEWISHLLYEDDSMTYIIRLAAARFALQNFETCVTWLTNGFITSKQSVKDASSFFKIHAVEFKDEDKYTLKTAVSLACAELVREVVQAGRGNGPFYVKFLSGALNCNIIQHYDNDCYNGRKVDKIPSLGIHFPSIDSSDRELHIYWMKSGDDTSDICRTLRLL